MQISNMLPSTVVFNQLSFRLRAEQVRLTCPLPAVGSRQGKSIGHSDESTGSPALVDYRRNALLMSLLLSYLVCRPRGFEVLALVVAALCVKVELTVMFTQGRDS